MAQVSAAIAGGSLMSMITHYNDGIYPAATLPRNGHSEFVQVATVQKEAFPLAGLLSNVMVQNLSKPDIQSAEYSSDHSWSFVPSMRGEFLDSMKKGSTVNASPLVNKQNLALSKVQSSDISIFDFLRCRYLTSRCKAETTNCPVVSPISLRFSTSFATSCGTRAAMVCDLLLIDFVAILESLHTRCSTVWQEINHCKCLTCSTPVVSMVFNTLSTGKAQIAHKIAKPGSASTLTGPLTQPLKQVTVMADKQHTQTRPKYQYRFLALNRADRTATPCRLSVEAETEREARQVLVRDFILVLAGRLPVKGVSHVA